MVKNIIFYLFIFTTINFSKANPTKEENAKNKSKITSVGSPEANKGNEIANASKAKNKTQNSNKKTSLTKHKFVANLLLQIRPFNEDKVKFKLGLSSSYEEEFWLTMGFKLNLDTFSFTGLVLLNEKTPALVLELDLFKAFHFNDDFLLNAGFLVFISKYGIFAGLKLEKEIKGVFGVFSVEVLIGAKFYNRSAYETYYE